MTTLVIGGSKSGKSSFAENLLEGFHGRKIYAATMQPYGEDAFEAIRRHRKMRAKKGFETVERYVDIGGIELPSGCALLIECMGNLCANEMFRDDAILSPADKITAEIRHLMDTAEQLVIVTNDVGRDEGDYEEGTLRYIRQLGEINRRIAMEADNVIECVYGIPVVLKGDILC